VRLRVSFKSLAVFGKESRHKVEGLMQPTRFGYEEDARMRVLLSLQTGFGYATATAMLSQQRVGCAQPTGGDG
jgi:hypothetical protein